MTYFNKVNNLEEAKKLYRELAMKNHPDRGGDMKVMQSINDEFELMCSLLSSTVEEGKEAFTSTFYNEGFTGSRYSSNRSLKEIAILVREYVKAKYPKFKFSVRTEYASMCQKLYITLTEGYTDLFVSEEEYRTKMREYYRHGVRMYGRSEEEIQRQIAYDWENKYRNNIQIRSYDNIKDADYGLRPEIYAMISDVARYAESYNYDHSDSMVDYFDVNFYFFGVSVGRYDKPYKINEKLVLRTTKFMKVA